MDEEKIIEKIMTLDEKVEQLATKDQVSKLESRILDVLDQQTVMLQKLDTEDAVAP